MCRLVTLAAAAGWLCGAVVAGAQAAGGQCEGTQPSVQTVQLVVVASPAQVAKAPGTLSQAPVVARDASTVVFADGRVVTSDVESASRHLNELGWGDRRVEFVASFKRSGPRRRKG